MTIRDQIIALASRPHGVNSAELQAACNVSAYHVASETLTMVNGGRLYRGKRAGERLRWFTSTEARDAWMLAAPTGQNAQTVMPQRLTAIGKPLKNRSRQPSKAPPLLAGSDQRRAVPPPVTVDLAWRDPAGEVDYSRAVYTLDTTPRPTARWQMQPDEPPLGFGKLPLGATLAGVRA